MDRFEAAFAKWVPRHRWFIIPLTLIAVAVCSIGTKNLYFDSSYKVFFGKDNPELSAFESIENTYSKYDTAMIVMAPTDGDVFTPATLAAVVEATELAWQVPYSNRVDSITNFQFTEGLEDDLIVRDMVSDPGSLSADDIALIRQRVLAEPILFKRLISESGHVTAVNVTVQIPAGEQTTSAPVVVAHVRALARDLEAKYPHIKVYLTGMVLMNYSFSEQAMADSSTLIPLSFLVMAVILALLVGGFAGTVSVLLIISFSIVVAMGLGGFIGFPITSPTATAPVVILTVAVANCVHMLVTFLHEMRHGLDKIAAMEESLRVNLQPVMVASVTTAIGFLTMTFSEVPPFQHLGIIVAIGVVTSFILSVTFLPAVLTLLPVRVKQTADDDYKTIVRFSEFVVRYRRSLLWGMSALIVFVTANIPRNELNDVFVHYFHEPIQFRLDSDYTVENLTGFYTVQFSLKAGESGGISNPDFLHDVDHFAEWLRAQPEIIHVDTFTDVMKRLNKNMHADDETFFHLPQDRDLAAQYLLLYEMSLPYGLDLNNQINVDKSSTRVTATLKILSSNELIAFDRRANKWLADNAPAVAETTSAGTTLMFSNIGKAQHKGHACGHGRCAGTDLDDHDLCPALAQDRDNQPAAESRSRGHGLWIVGYLCR